MRSLIFFSLLIVNSFAFAQSINLEPYGSGFSSPIGIYNAGDARLFIVERSGRIDIIDANGAVLSTPFLDIDDRVVATGGFSERGLLGLAFDPDYDTNGYFYVHYSSNAGDSQISRFSVMADNPNRADADSEFQILTMDQPYQNHNGGDLQFGQDGFLYIGMGDGGFAGDPENRAQNPMSFMGKMLRIDVKDINDVTPYHIPADNPFAGSLTVLNEIWSLGLRNPWRFSFDRLTGDMYIADVGQDAWAEIDFEAAGSTGGKNFGWRCYEGDHPYNLNGCGSIGDYEGPIYEYAHGPNSPCSITGGYVYRGCKYADLYGKYIYADYCSGDIWTLSNENGNWVNEDTNNTISTDWSSFGEGADGTIYICGLQSGLVYKITTNNVNEAPTVVADDNVLEFTGGDLQPYTGYQWYLDGEAIPGANQIAFVATESGDYSLEVFTDSGCSLITDAVNVVISTVNSITGLSDISVFPNPFTDNFEVQINSSKLKNLELELIDISGKKIWMDSWDINGNANRKIDAKHLTPGVYYLMIKDNSGYYVQKITKGES